MAMDCHPVSGIFHMHLASELASCGLILSSSGGLTEMRRCMIRNAPLCDLGEASDWMQTQDITKPREHYLKATINTNY